MNVDEIINKNKLLEDCSVLIVQGCITTSLAIFLIILSCFSVSLSPIPPMASITNLL
jgi:hypothetical protein